VSKWSIAARAAAVVAALICLGAPGALAQSNVRAIALKSGETTEMGKTYWIIRGPTCRSTLQKIEGVEVLEGPPELTVTVREEQVLPDNCGRKVPGGIVIISAKDVKTPVHGKLVYRIKYKTKDGDRQSSYIYDFALYP
jgi:hypothetical protein